MGDNRDNSTDSRFWGFVPEETCSVKSGNDLDFNLTAQKSRLPPNLGTERRAF